MTSPAPDMFDHLSLGVRDLEAAAAFYDATLAALGYVCVRRTPRSAEYGPPGHQGECFAILANDAASPNHGFHLAFRAPSRAAVDAFHAAAMAAGGRDEGPPGIRQSYDPGYYAAFVRDLDGHRLEAVVHEPVPPA